jgi:trans-2,3-dihydro-3-hydroxyanthranilate isomerase
MSAAMSKTMTGTSEYPFRVVNVFTAGDDPLSGNPLCVFEDAAGLSDERMQALARQFNLSETAFVFPSTAPAATARVRIFTPAFELPFAGHPTLGTAHVVRELRRMGDRVVLELPVGLVEVTANTANHWTLVARAPHTRVPEASSADLAAMLSVPEGAVGPHPLWVDTGTEQLVVPLTSVNAVRQVRPDAERFATVGFSTARGASLVYVWAWAGDDEVVARFFFSRSMLGIAEDPATGSACANLGGWMLATGAPLPIGLNVRQGEAVSRPSRLRLDVGRDRSIRVGGQVRAIARGAVTL